MSRLINYINSESGPRAKILTLASTSAVADPTSAFVAARDMGGGWIEVDYDDDAVGASDLPNTGIVIELAAPPGVSAPGVGLYWLSIEVESVPVNGQAIALVGSDTVDLASGNARGCGLSSNGTTITPRSLDRVSQVAVATAFATVRFVSWHQARFSGGGLTTQRASTVMGHQADGTFLAAGAEVAAQSSPTTYFRAVVGHTATGPGGTQTARFRPRIFAWSDAQALGLA